MKEDGTFEELKLKGIIYSGKRLLDYIEDAVKMAYFLPEDDPTKDWYRDFMWYLWCGPKSRYTERTIWRPLRITL